MVNSDKAQLPGASTVVAGVPPANLLTAADTSASTARSKNLRAAFPPGRSDLVSDDLQFTARGNYQRARRSLSHCLLRRIRESLHDVNDCRISHNQSRLRRDHTKVRQMAARRKSNRHRACLCAVGLRKNALQGSLCALLCSFTMLADLLNGICNQPTKPNDSPHRQALAECSSVSLQYRFSRVRTGC